MKNCTDGIGTNEIFWLVIRRGFAGQDEVGCQKWVLPRTATGQDEDE